MVGVMGVGSRQLRRGRGGEARTVFAYLAREDGLATQAQIGEVLGISEAAGSKLRKKDDELMASKRGRALVNRIRERIRANRRGEEGCEVIEALF